jgi:DNA-binding NtrC family response regulator
LRLSAGAVEALLTYDWPGNVRELERLVERAVALTESDVIELDDLPATVRGEFTTVVQPSLRRNDTMRVWARRYARIVVARVGGNKRQAARALGISYHTLNSYLKQSTEAPPGAGEAAEGSPAEDAVVRA